MRQLADRYSRGLALLAVVALVMAWPLFIGALLAQILLWLTGWAGDGTGWCLLFAAAILPYAFGRAAPHIHRLTQPRP